MRAIIRSIPQGTPVAGSESAFEEDKKQMMAILSAVYGPRVAGIEDRFLQCKFDDLEDVHFRNIWEVVQGDAGMAAVIVGCYDPGIGFPAREKLMEIAAMSPVPVLLEVRNHNLSIGVMTMENGETRLLHPIAHFVAVTKDGALVMISAFF